MWGETGGQENGAWHYTISLFKILEIFLFCNLFLDMWLHCECYSCSYILIVITSWSFVRNRKCIMMYIHEYLCIYCVKVFQKTTIAFFKLFLFYQEKFNFPKMRNSIGIIIVHIYNKYSYCLCLNGNALLFQNLATNFVT